MHQDLERLLVLQRLDSAAHAARNTIDDAPSKEKAFEARLAVVGNVFTHDEFRGRGYAKAVTSAVTAELLRTCDQVVLNVRSDNPPALQAYARLGYREHVRFEERLIHRLGSGWPGGLTGTLRRLLSPWKES